MMHKAADLSLSIKIVTSLVLLLMVAFLIGSIFQRALLIPGGLLFIISAFCYIYAPVGYKISSNKLFVFNRMGKKEFGPVVNCFSIVEKIPCSIRLWGNGGLFAGTGIFWNRSYGIFRVYVTSSRQLDFVVVETAKRKILISPENTKNFIESCKICSEDN